MNLPEACIRRPVMTTLLTAAICVFGLMAFRLLPVSDLPNVDFPTIVVSASLPGATPETMASAVATVLEQQFSTIAGIDSQTSTSSTGNTQITLQFTLDRNIDAAAQDVQAAIAAVQRRLPTDMPAPPSLRKTNPADQPVIFMALYSPTLPLSVVDEYAETMMSQLISSVEVVKRVRALLPVFATQLPESVHLSIMRDNSEAVRDSVNDVQTTLMLSIGLVILVIFIFLRSVWATVIPSFAIPLALLGTFVV